MPKLLLCDNKDCQKSKKCRRHADSGCRQDPPSFYLIVRDPARCQAYYPVEKRK